MHVRHKYVQAHVFAAVFGAWLCGVVLMLRLDGGDGNIRRCRDKSPLSDIVFMKVIYAVSVLCMWRNAAKQSMHDLQEAG